MLKKSSKYYEQLLTERSIDYKSINKSLDIVKQFIIDKKLLLYGGMAIDYALKMKGDFIYPENSLPDYDFYSSEHIKDATELGEILCKNKLHNVSIKNGSHITTSKVRVDNENVADIAYCPKHILDKIPYLVYKGFKIVHPYWQYIDQHISLSLPFRGGRGKEVIFFRWKKDMERYDMLYKHYPLVHSNGVFNRALRDEYRDKLMLPFNKILVPLSMIRNVCVVGWGSIYYKIIDNNIEFKIPKGYNLQLLSYDYKEYINEQKLTPVEYISEFMGKLPRKIICETKSGINIDLYDGFGMLVSAKNINKNKNIWICNTQYAMIYFALEINITDDPKKKFTAEELYIKCIDMVIKGYYPSISVYGKFNMDISEYIFKKNTLEAIYDIKNKDIIPPKSYPKYPKCKTRNNFDYKKSKYFDIGGEKTKEFIPLTLEPIINKI